MNAIKTFFANLKLQHKLMLCFACLTAMLFLAMGGILRVEYARRCINDEMSKVEQVMQQAADALTRSHSLLVRNTSRLLLEENLFQALSALNSGQNIQYAQNYQQINELLSDYVFQMEMIDSVCLFYNGFSYGSQYGLWENDPYGVMDRFVPGGRAFQFYPANYTAQTAQADVFPLAIQLAFQRGANGDVLTYSAPADGQMPIVFWVFLKQQYIDDLIQVQSTAATDRFYLVDEDGNWLTRPLSQKVQTPYPDEVEAFLRRTSYCMNEPFETGGDTLYVSKASSGIEGVYLVHVFAKSTVESQNTPIYSALGAIWGCGVLAFSVITLLIAAFLTKPFETLRQIVDEINRGVYDRPRQFKYRDEAGLLGAQINQMYATIQEQIRQIKREEAEKAQAEIQMYSEQINPHFLYNTLERIHFQILNEHTEAASRMVESLGQYLRITLSHGQLLIPLEKEIAHVTQYMNIINSHAQEDKIRFACHCDSALLSRPVLKLILQPLVENAVKHGFSQDLRSYILPPEITVTVTAGDDYLQYEIADNGKGVDIPHAEACMRRSYQENGSHFGLQNIYRRLRSTYGDGVSIRFSSIPYLRSVVTVRIPQQPKAMQ